MSGKLGFKSRFISAVLAFSLIFSVLNVQKDTGKIFTAQAMTAGSFTGEQYKKALWMVTRFYGAQRMGEGPNWLTLQHTVTGTGGSAYNGGKSFLKDADGSHNLVGGWVDCGDHVLFGQTFFYSAYMLALAYKTFPEGFHDLYNGVNYSDYLASNDWSINGGSPNGVPDLLEELKYATDWIIKATPNGTTFYSQKGNGHKDHQQWVTSGFMSTLPEANGGERDKSREIVKNPNDGIMPSFAAGTLAIMSEIYRPYDSAYADLCLQHARNAYTYARSKRDNSEGADGGFYGAAKDPRTIFLIAASEMYMATNETTYFNDIDTSRLQSHWHVLDYSNAHDLANYAVYKATGSSTALSNMKEWFIDKYTSSSNINSEGATTLGGGWGELRYNGNVAFSAALYANAVNSTSYDTFITNQVDFTLGKNNANRSFVVGFDERRAGAASDPIQVRWPHHRNVFLNDTNPANKQLTIPERNKYFGYLVGGRRNSTSFQDSTESYQQSEGGIDYNAGLLGALAYIVSKKAPADNTDPCENGHTPDMTENCTVCSVCKTTGLTKSCPTSNPCNEHKPLCPDGHTPKSSNCTECSVCPAKNLPRTCPTSSPCPEHADKILYNMQTDDLLPEWDGGGTNRDSHWFLTSRGGNRAIAGTPPNRTITITGRGGGSQGVEIRLFASGTNPLVTKPDHEYRFEISGRATTDEGNPSHNFYFRPALAGASTDENAYGADAANATANTNAAFNMDVTLTHEQIQAYITAGANVLRIGGADRQTLVISKLIVTEKPSSIPVETTAPPSTSTPPHTTTSSPPSTSTSPSTTTSPGTTSEPPVTTTAPQEPSEPIGSIKNDSDKSILTKGLYLTNDSDKFKWQFPAHIIRPGKSVVIYGDGIAPDNMTKRTKANFIPKPSETVRVYYANGDVGDLLE